MPVAQKLYLINYQWCIGKLEHSKIQKYWKVFKGFPKEPLKYNTVISSHDKEKGYFMRSG